MAESKMNKLEQAARQALEALEELHYSSGTVVAVRMYESATAALREALAEQVKQEPVAFRTMEVRMQQAEQEPVGYVDEALRIKWLIDYDAVSKLTGHKLYATPVRTKDLTDDEIWKIWFKDITLDWDERCRAVIAADREKNK